MKCRRDILSCRMAVDIVSLGLELIERYGLIAIFILLVLDGALLLPVFPGEVVLVMAVATYATDPTTLVMLILMATAAGMIGSYMLYGMIRGGGRPLVEKYPGFFMMPKKRRERLERAFRHPFGQTLVMWLRLFPLTRIIVNIPAGLAKMPIVRFTIFSAVGLLAYHTAFMWFAYEARQPDSAVGSEATRLKEAYANPAMEFVEANAILTGLAVLVLGIIFSVRASRQMMRDPDESAGSIIGTLATVTLFWGGMALAMATYMDPRVVYAMSEAGGLDVQALAAETRFSAVQLLWGASAIAIILGAILRGLNRHAKDRRKQGVALQRYTQRLEKERNLRRALEAQRAQGARSDPYAPRDPVPRSGDRSEGQAPADAAPRRPEARREPPRHGHAERRDH